MSLVFNNLHVGIFGITSIQWYRQGFAYQSLVAIPPKRLANLFFWVNQRFADLLYSLPFSHHLVTIILSPPKKIGYKILTQDIQSTKIESHNSNTSPQLGEVQKLYLVLVQMLLVDLCSMLVILLDYHLDNLLVIMLVFKKISSKCV